MYYLKHFFVPWMRACAREIKERENLRLCVSAVLTFLPQRSIKKSVQQLLTAVLSLLLAADFITCGTQALFILSLKMRMNYSEAYSVESNFSLFPR
jgi:hypothetical protein